VSFGVARAYIDQLARGTVLAPDRIAALNAAISGAEASPTNRKNLNQLKALAASLDKDVAKMKPSADSERMRALAAILEQKGNARP
jgi:hypothetical protein